MSAWRRRSSPKRRDARPNWWVLLAVFLSMTAVLFAHAGARTSNKAHAPLLKTSIPGAKKYTHFTNQTPIAWSSGAPATNQKPNTPSDSASSVLITPAPTVTAQTTQQFIGTPYSVTTYPGYLSYPDNVSTSFPIPAGATAVSASATWQGDGTLDLALECPSNEHDAMGSGSTVTISGALTGSPCELILSEDGEVTYPVSYSLVIKVTTSA